MIRAFKVASHELYSWYLGDQPMLGSTILACFENGAAEPDAECLLVDGLADGMADDLSQIMVTASWRGVEWWVRAYTTYQDGTSEIILTPKNRRTPSNQIYRPFGASRAEGP